MLVCSLISKKSQVVNQLCYKSEVTLLFAFDLFMIFTHKHELVHGQKPNELNGHPTLRRLRIPRQDIISVKIFNNSRYISKSYTKTKLQLTLPSPQASLFRAANSFRVTWSRRRSLAQTKILKSETSLAVGQKTNFAFQRLKYTGKRYRWKAKVQKNAQSSINYTKEGFSLQHFPSRNAKFSARRSALPVSFETYVPSRAVFEAVRYICNPQTR